MERPTWSNKLEYHLSLFSYVIGLSTSWRFPYLTLENGGAPFIYSFLVLFILVGIPLVFLDLAWGQYSNLAPAQAFKVVPVLQGAGLCILIMSFVVLIYFGIVSYYLLIYLSSSFADPFPWLSCKNQWNTEACESALVPTCNTDGVDVVLPTSPNITANFANTTANIMNTTIDAITTPQPCINITNSKISSSAIEYWNHISLNDNLCSEFSNDNMSNMLFGGDKTTDIILAPAIVFGIFVGVRLFFSVLALAKHVNLTGKVSYLFSTFPFAVSIMMLVRCLTLENSLPAVAYLFVPKSFEEFAKPKLWKDAMGQVFLSLMTTWGGLLTWSSYNKFYNKFHLDASVLIITVPFISIISSVTMFCVVGYLAHEKSTDISTVIASVKGPMAPLVLLTEALSTMWGYKIPWSILVFVTMFLSSIATQLPSLECILSSLSDTFVVLRRLWIRDIIVVIVVLSSMCIYYLLPCIFQGVGMMVIELTDTFFFPFAFILLALILLFMICYAFGFHLLGTNTKAMTRNACLTSKFWLVMWGFLTPLLLLACMVYIIYGIIVDGVSSLSPTLHDDLRFEWCHEVTWILLGFFLFILILVTVVHVLRSPGTFTEKLKHAFSAQPARMAASSSGAAIISNGGGGGRNSPSNGHLFMGGYASHRDGDEVLVDDDIVTSV